LIVRKHESEWITISDMMAGITGVVMLLLVVSVVQSSVMAAEQEAKNKQGVSEVMKEIKKGMETLASTSGIKVDSIITLGDKTFCSGSACLDDDAAVALRDIAGPIVVNALKKYPNISVQIEGHTDPQNVTKMSTDLSKCALFDDNYTLSAGRAREARKALLSTMGDNSEFSKRISVVGYGPDRLKNTKNTTSPENRRVEVRLVSLAE